MEKEEEKPDYDQERINNWREELKEIIKEQDAMDAKAEGFTKGILLSVQRLIGSRRGVSESIRMLD